MVVGVLGVPPPPPPTHTHRDPEFSGRLLEAIIPILLHPHTSTHIFHSLTLGLEYLVVNFSVTVQERVSLARTAASRFAKCDQHKSLAALALLVTCMYTGGCGLCIFGFRWANLKVLHTHSGEEADALSGLTTDLEGSAAMETAAHAREYISNMMER